MTCNLCRHPCECGAEEAMRLTELERAPAAKALDAELLAYAAATPPKTCRKGCCDFAAEVADPDPMEGA